MVALVELEEGPRLLTNIVGVQPRGRWRCDMPVEGGVRRCRGRRVRAEVRTAERARQVMGALDTDMRVRDAACPRAGCQPLARCSCNRARARGGTTAGTAGAQEILLSRAPDRQQMILDGARKEGRVVLYSRPSSTRPCVHWPRPS